MLLNLEYHNCLTLALQIVTGDITNHDDLSGAVSRCRGIISLLGPGPSRQPRNTFADCYRTITPLMKQHGVRRLIALGTTAIYQRDDQTSAVRYLMAGFIRIAVNAAYQNIMAIQEYFEALDDASIEWTVYRLGMLSGTGEPAVWSENRNKGEVYAGPVGAPGYTSAINRSILAKWLVDTCLESTAKWTHKMPAVSNKGK
jgi:hypothetical protein